MSSPLLHLSETKAIALIYLLGCKPSVESKMETVRITEQPPLEMVVSGWYYRMTLPLYLLRAVRVIEPGTLAHLRM